MLNQENKYSEIIKNYTFEQLVYERAILEKEKDNIYIKDKELKEEFKRRLAGEKWYGLFRFDRYKKQK